MAKVLEDFCHVLCPSAVDKFLIQSALLQYSIFFSVSSREAYCHTRLEPLGLDWLHTSAIRSTKREEKRGNQPTLGSFANICASGKSESFEGRYCLLQAICLPQITLYIYPPFFIFLLTYTCVPSTYSVFRSFLFSFLCAKPGPLHPFYYIGFPT